MWTASARVQNDRSGARYASDVTDAEFALIEPLLPAPKRGGRPRTTSLREVVGASLRVAASQMSLDGHALVENAADVDAGGRLAVEADVRATGVFPVAATRRKAR